MDITQEQVEEIKQRALEAESFRRSALFARFVEFMDNLKADAVNSLLTNSRQESQKNLLRTEFVERQCGYILALDVARKYFDAEALKLEQILKLEKERDGRTITSTSQDE